MEKIVQYRLPLRIELDGARQEINAKFQPLIREDLGFARLVSYVGNKSVPILSED